MKRLFKPTLLIFLIHICIGNMDCLSQGYSQYPSRTEKGYQLRAEFEFEIERFDDHGINFYILNAYRFNPYLMMGLGTGLKFFMGSPETYLPICIDITANDSNQTFDPYIRLKVGYPFELPKDNTRDKRLFFSPSIGLIIKPSEKTNLNVGIGVNIYRFKHYNSIFNTETKSSERTIGITTGLTF